MPPWHVNYPGKRGKRLGTVEAPDERSAVAEAAKTFHITPASRFKIAVMPIEAKSEK